jgi:uncharacterized protein YcbK (DUF882 family)
MTKPNQLGRRQVLRLTLSGLTAAGATSLIATSALAAPTGKRTPTPAPSIIGKYNPNIRSLAMVNAQSGEAFKGVYYADGDYQAEALARITSVMRDNQTGDTHDVHPDLVDLLSKLQHRLNTQSPYVLISGYRSVETNEMLALTSRGVARNSYHLDGMAADIRLPGRGLRQIRDAAVALRGGGVGYYARSNFVHVDCGPVRRW